MPTIGCLDEFCIESWNISSNLDHVGQFFIANNIALDTQMETKCKAILLGAIGEKVYSLWGFKCTLKAKWGISWGN